MSTPHTIKDDGVSLSPQMGLSHRVSRAARFGLLTCLPALLFAGWTVMAAPVSAQGGIKAPGSTAVYAFPGHAEDLDPGSYWYWGRAQHSESGTQKFGYDLTTTHYDEQRKRWTRLKEGVDPDAYEANKTNAAWDCYNLPVYAMADGEVIAAWRNSPENPRPGEKHPGLTSTPLTVGRGGNFLLIEYANGRRTLYAHFRPGTIPSSLCPHDAVFRKNGDDGNESMIPEGKRPHVKRGQFLGRIGNTGQSTNPHLHIHDVTPGDLPIALDFQEAWIQDVENRPEIGDWKEIKSDPIPAGPLAILPPFGPGHREVARHGVPASQYQFTVEHAVASGYAPEWVDGFSVNNHLYFNIIFRPSTSRNWATFHNLDGAQYQAEFEKRERAGYHVVHIDSYPAGGKALYAVIFRKKEEPQTTAYHGITPEDHQKRFDDLTSHGWKPVNISVVSLGAQRRYTALYEKSSAGSLIARSFLTGAEYQAEYETNKQAGRQLVYLDAYTYLGKLRFSAIWESGIHGQFKAKHSLTGSEYQQEWEEALKEGLLTRAVTGYEEGNQRQYAAVWRK